MHRVLVLLEVLRWRLRKIGDMKAPNQTQVILCGVATRSLLVHSVIWNLT